MSKVIFDISMSLDGFVTAANVRPEEPMGDGGQRLHEWAFGDDECNRELLAEAVHSLGAVIAADAPTTTRFRGGGRTARPAPPGFPCSSSPTPSRRMCPRGASTPSSPTASRAR